MSRRSCYEDDPDSGSITWPIVKQIIQECGRRGESIDEELVCFTLKLVFQDPKFGFDESVPLTRDEVQRLISLCIQKLLQDNGPIMETVRMQWEFESNHGSHSDIILNHNRDLEEKMQPLTREIVESQARGRTAIDALYNKVVTVLVLRSGLGSPTNGKVLREAAAAVHSVFPPSELARFMSMNALDKKSHLRELSLVVAGIRLYNWDANKGGAGIENLPSILNNAVEATQKNMAALAAYTADKAHRLTALTEKLIYTEAGSMVPEDHRQHVKYGLVNIRQFQVYLNKIMTEVKSCSARLSNLDQELLSRLTSLQNGISSRMAVPSVQAFPLLVRLARTWQGFQEEMVVLSHLNTLLKTLYNHTRCLADLPTLQGLGSRSLSQCSSVSSDEERNYQNCKGKINTQDFVCKLITPGDVPNYDKLPLYASGFCPVALVTGQGFVLPGNPRLGFLKYEDKYFSISTVDRADQMGTNPKLFLSAIEKLTRESPCLLKLLNVMEDEGEVIRPVTADRAAQTDTHPIERLKDPRYQWNEWEMRREALQLSDLRQRSTHSAQTDLKINHREAETQVWSLKEESTQTIKDSSTHMKPSRSVVLGLRGESNIPVEHILLDDLILTG